MPGDGSRSSDSHGHSHSRHNSSEVTASHGLLRDKLPAGSVQPRAASGGRAGSGGILEAWPKVPKQRRVHPDGSPIGRSVVLGQQGERLHSPPSPTSPDAPASPTTSNGHRATWPPQQPGADWPASAEEAQRSSEPGGAGVQDLHLLPPQRKQQQTSAPHALSSAQPKPPSIHPYAANGALALNQRLNRHRQRKPGAMAQTAPLSSTPAAPATRNTITQPELGGVSAWVSTSNGHPLQGEVPGRVPWSASGSGGGWGLQSKGLQAHQTANGDGALEGLVGGEVEGALIQGPRRGRVVSEEGERGT
ncbi:hypothetical protein DUNSADRAFT_10716 [Dunaliella salina]|uniref:Encoded protein n=1 Tax=Dunaliella salina TaxID=3046 RepID=A0ABQ7GES8_DUNSA|nr:hypothetical protein DUNSADRAFT_10716 [Dunaliella salina]|eukprot:KAF5833097.1 hypothetical protein DUNSADRAFT_10716 [Dunaliella salina]